MRGFFMKTKLSISIFLTIIIISIVLFLFTFVSVSAANDVLVDYDNFNQYEVTELKEEYNSMIHETESDGVTDNSVSFLGCKPAQYVTKVYMLLEHPETATVNEIGFNLTTSSGSPENRDLIYSLSICETSVTSLDNSNDSSQCDTTPIILFNDFEVSTRWDGNPNTLTSIIPFNQLYQMYSNKKYIIMLNFDSGQSGFNSMYKIRLDTNPTTKNFYKIIYNDGINIQLTSIADIRLYKADWDIDNFHAESNYTWRCNSIPHYHNQDCVDNILSPFNSNGNWSIKENGIGNNYLSLINLNGSITNGYTATRLSWLHTHSTSNLGANGRNYTLIYDIRLNNAEPERFIGFHKKRGIGGILHYYDYGIQDIGWLAVGGVVTDSFEDWNRLRVNYAFDTMKPDKSDCDINNGDWHTVAAQYLHNSSLYHVGTHVYIDGVLCMNYTLNKLQTSGMNMFNSFNVIAQAVVDFDIDNIMLYEGRVYSAFTPGEELPTICPVAHCLFYDEFSYVDNFDLSQSPADYSEYTEKAIIKDNRLYFNSTWEIGSYAKIRHEFIPNSYRVVTGFTQFKISDNPTPDSMDLDIGNQPIVYSITTYCNDTNDYVTLYNIYLFNDKSFSLSENMTIVNIYTKNPNTGNMVILGTFTVRNGDYFALKNKIDLDKNRVYLNMITQEELTRGYAGDSMFNIELEMPCSNNLNAVQISRLDTYNENSSLHVGIEKIMYYGYSEMGQDNDTYNFKYGNKTTQEDSIVKDDVGEVLHNTAFTLGFKSNASKLFFWSIIMLFAMFMLLHSNAPANAKTFGAVGIFVMFLVSGFYFKFVSSIVFTFILFIIAVIGAIAFTMLFKGGSGSGAD